MLCRRTSLCIVALALCTPAPAAITAQSSAALDVVLPRLFAYVERFDREFGSMVVEERYEQTLRRVAGTGVPGGETRRVLRSDFLLVNVPGQGWMPFRDVFEADGRRIRDREDRLTALFLSGR
jgi:hypothetical protein